MMTIDMIAAITVFALVVIATPGPNNLMLMASGINFGFSKTLPHITGIFCGLIAMIFLVGIGLTNIFEMFPITYDIIKCAGIGYLLFLAWKIANAKGNIQKDTSRAAEVKPLTFLQAALFQWVNPKAWTIILTAISSYAIPSQPFVSICLIAAIFALITIPSISAWAYMGVQMRRFLNNPRRIRIFNILAALLLVLSLYPALF